ncbi:MAG: amino acid hydroxylase [Chloroflexi bacterium]|nr:amino acid hydroxylase [Chloroflexota bacterium]
MINYQRYTIEYDPEDHDTWNKLCTRQHDLVASVACQEFFPGIRRIELDYTRVPDLATMSQQMQRLVDWTLTSAENEYLADDVWFEHLRARRFPVTNYIRRPHELDFTPIPDLFHEYFGHLAFVSDPRFAAQAEAFGHLYHRVPPENRLEVANLWWFSWEFGFIRQSGQLRVFGAGLLSSPGELRYALSDRPPKIPFALSQLMSMRRSPHEYHDAYFVYESFDQIDDTLEALRQKYLA